MISIPVKPLSVNKAYRGRKFATKELKSYQNEVAYLLPKLTLPKGKLRVIYQFGVSSRGSDGDNLIKCFQDVLSEKYGFNDNQIYQWSVKKVVVPKGKEFVSFSINSYEQEL